MKELGCEGGCSNTVSAVDVGGRERVKIDAVINEIDSECSDITYM